MSGFLSRNGLRILPHPPDSPDLAPSDFFLFGHVKQSVAGMTFASRDEVFEAILIKNLHRFSTIGWTGWTEWLRTMVNTIHDRNIGWFTFSRLAPGSEMLHLGGALYTSEINCMT
jgi:hypothetical protein